MYTGPSLWLHASTAGKVEKVSIQTGFDNALLGRYDRPGPRYTSYPSALQFSPDFTAADLRREAMRSNERRALPASSRKA